MLVIAAGARGGNAADTLHITAPYTHWHDTVIDIRANSVVMVERTAHLTMERVTIKAPNARWQGIQVHDSASLTLRHCFIADAEFGVQALGNTGDVVIEHSCFERNKCAVQLHSLHHKKQQVTLRHNYMNVNPSGAPGMGITVYGSLGGLLFSKVLMQHNTIYLNNGSKGICVMGVNAPPCGVLQNRNGGCGYFHIQNNTIHLNSNCNSDNCTNTNQRNEDGIFISNSSGIYVRENTIDRTATPAFNTAYNYGNTNPMLYPHGITLQGNTGGNNAIYCNTVSNTYTGYRVEGQNSNTDFMGNNIGNPTGVGNRLGLHVLNLAAMIPTGALTAHIDKGNKWYGSYAANQSARNENGAWSGNVWIPNLPQVALSKFIVAPTSPWSPVTPFPPVTSWIEATGTVTTDPCSTIPPSYKTDETTIRPHEIGAYERGVIQKKWTYAKFEEVTQYETETMVYQKIVKAKAERLLTQEESDFYQKQSGRSIGRFAALDSSVAQLLQRAGSLNDEQWQAQLNVLGSMNNDIRVNSVFEQLSKDVNTVYLNSIRRNGLSVYTRGQMDTLGGIAQLCYHEFGSAVAKSRAMLGSFDTRSYDRFDNCLGESPLAETKPDSTEPTAYILVPNPASNQLTLNKTTGLFSGERFSVMDMAGAELMRYEETGESNSITLSTKTLSSGTYIVSIYSRTTLIANLKLVIIK